MRVQRFVAGVFIDERRHRGLRTVCQPGHDLWYLNKRLLHSFEKGEKLSHPLVSDPSSDAQWML